MRDIKTIFMSILAAAALWPASLVAQLTYPEAMTAPLLPNGSTAFMMNTNIYQDDEWSMENRIARDASTGDLYVAGTFYDNAAGGSRIFVRKISSVGTEVWTTTVTNSVMVGGGWDYGRSVALSPDGNSVYVLGVQQLDTQDVMLFKYSSAGKLLWERAYDSGDHSDNAYDMAVDATDIYVAGTKQNDIAIFKFKADNSVAPVAYAFDGGDYYNTAYAIDMSSDTIALAGTIYDARDYNDPNDLEYGNEIWVAKYRKSDMFQYWASTYTSANHPEWGSDEAHGVRIDPNYNIYAVGYYYSYDSGQDIWLGKYDPSGNLLYARTKNPPSNGYDRAFGLDLDSFNNIYVTGRVEAHNLNQGNNLWLGKYSPSGALLSEVNIHSNESYQELGYDVKVASHMVYVGGAFAQKYGIVQVYPEQFGAPPDLFAGPGWYTGSVNLNWMFETAGDYDYKIQVATYAAADWSVGNAGITGTALDATNMQHEVKGLPVRIDYTEAGQEPGPVYYFRLWTSPAGQTDWTQRDTTAAAAPFAPYNYWNQQQRGQDTFWVFNSAYGDSAAVARDADGYTYAAYPANMGGLAIVKFGPYGNARWASFYNDADENSSYSVRRLEVGPGGNLYAAGAATPGTGGAQGGISKAWLAKFNSLGLKVWDAELGDTEVSSAFNTVTMSSNGVVYAGGHFGADNAMLLAGYHPVTGAMLSSATHRSGNAAVPDSIWGLAYSSATGSDILYAGGQFNYANGNAVDGDAAIVKFDSSLSVLGSPMRYTNAPTGADIASGDAIYDLAISGGQLYAAGAKYTHGASDNYSNFWLATMATSDLIEDWSEALNNSATHLPAAARGVALNGGYLYASGHETRLSQQEMEHQNIIVRKYDVENLAAGAVWGRVVDGTYQEESVRGFGVRVGGDGYFYVPALFNAWEDQMSGTVQGSPGIARLAEPQSGLIAQPGYKPGSVQLAWVATTDLPQGTTFYVHHATHTEFTFSEDSAQFSYYLGQPAFTGDYINRLVPGLESGLGAAGINSPVHYFKMGYKDGGTVTPIGESTSAVANTPGVWDRMNKYGNGSFFMINGAHGGRNPLVRDAAGNIYTAGYFNPWGSFYAAYVRKFDSMGRPVWTRFYADQYEYSQPVINALALDADGNLYAAGTAGSEGWTNTYPYGPESATKRDGLLLKFSAADGRMHWARPYDLAGAGQNDEFYALAAGPVYVYAAGKTYNDNNESPGYQSDDAVVLAFDTDGEQQFSYVSGRAGADDIYSLSYDTVNNVLYAGGQVSSGGGYDGVIKRFTSQLSGAGSDITLSGGSMDAVYAVKVDTSASSAFYAAGVLDDANGNQDAWLARYAYGTDVPSWDITYNSANQNEDAAYGIALDGLGGVYISGSESRYDINQGRNLFMRKHNAETGDLIWSQTLNSSGYNDDTGGGIAVDSANGVYAAVDAGYMTAATYNTEELSGAGFFKHVQFNMNVTNPRLTVRVSSGTGPGQYLPGIGMAVMGFSQTGGIDPNAIYTGVTDSTGSAHFQMPAGKSYFIAVSSHNMVPTIKDQLSDPNGNFFVDLNVDATKQYYISPRQAAADPVHKMLISFSTHTDTLHPGDFVMGEVFITQTGERVGYSVVKLPTGAGVVSGSMEVHNLAEAAEGVYGMAVSVPARNKVLQIFMTGPFPSTSSYRADMTQASQLTGSFEVGASTVPPSIMGMVMTENWSPIEGARVSLQRDACSSVNNGPPVYCESWQNVFNKEVLTDAGGSFSFYNVPFSSCTNMTDFPANCTDAEHMGMSYRLNVGKAGYASGYANFNFPVGTPTPYMGSGMPGDSTMFNLQVATYTLTGVLKYNGVPLPNANIMVFPDWRSYSYESLSASDSYRQGEWGGGMGIRSDARVRTGADGTFTVSGLTDGNARIEAAFEGGWRSLNEGNSYETQSDNLRVVISSQGARGPGLPSNNACRPGRVWVVNSSGSCVTAGNVAFNIVPEGGNIAGRLWGNVTFVTTYTVTSSNPLVISTASPLTIMAQQQCRDGDCGNQQMGFTSLAGTFLTNTTSYSITLSTGFTYYPRLFSTAWARASSFDSSVDLASTDTFRQDISVLKGGGLRGVLKFPDGSNFKQSCSNSGCAWSADIEIRGVNVDVGDGRNVDDYGEFEFPNLAPGNYKVSVRPRGSAFVWAPAVLENVAVVEGRTTEVKLQLEEGLAVKPNIVGLPSVSTSSWRYVVISVPSGTEMNQKTVTELFFSKTEYGFDYSTSTGWSTMYMAPGQYDFYLLLASQYDPCDGGGECVQSFQQFGNFIGRLKGKSIQKDNSNPSVGTGSQPIGVEILGSVGQAGLAGTVVGENIFTAPDFEKIFSNFDAMFEVIPAVMLYDSAGDLKGFTNAMPGDMTSLNAFLAGLKNQDAAAVRSVLSAYPMTYGVWGLPHGRYTVVFNNPNYPPVAKELLDITSPGSDVTTFDFDDADVVTADISGVVLSSATLEPLGGARVFLRHRTVEKFALTNSSGAFTFDNLPLGIYRLEVMRNGYVTVGEKTSLAANDAPAFTMYMRPSVSKISGRVYMSKFPTQVTKAGVEVVAYDETENVNNPAAYLPKSEVQTDASGNFEINGVVPNHIYKLSAFYTGKMPAIMEVTALDGNTVVSDITLKDIPPQISIKVRKSADSVNKVDVIIKSPKALMTTPSCVYSPGETLDGASAVTLALVPGPNRTYLGQFTVSSGQRYYTVKVTAGDAGNKMEKTFTYDKVSNAKTEQYIQQESLAGGSVQMDKETEEYSGIELDPGALSYSTATATDYTNLVGGFFSSLPSVRTVKTDKGELTISDAIQSLMASEVYNMDLSNASANKPFTLTLKYDKERGAAHTGTMRIYQQDADGNWQEVPGNYTVDPMLGVLSVDVGSLTNATQGAAAAATPLGRKRLGMSSVVNGRYVPAATPTVQNGRFAVMTAPPTQGAPAFSGSFEIFNLPNPFDLKSKSVALDATDLNGAAISPYTTSGTVLKFNLPAGKGGNVKFVVYNLAGEKVRTLDMGNLAGGKIYYSEWDGRNDKNAECASGVYFLLPFVNGEKLTGKAHKMAIIK